jgi:DNA-3-methyladenine glycosylase II
MRHALNHLRQADPVLAGVIDRVGPFRMAYREPDFSTLARSIVYQQLSGKAAATIFGRLEAAVAPEPITAAGVAALSEERLRSLGLSTQKTSYLRDLAGHCLNGALDLGALPGLEDEQVIARLTAVRGVGVWTSQMFLMFALRRPDILPTADLGIRSAMKRLYRMRAMPKPVRMEKVAKPWRPYASVACWYLWRSLDNVAAL